jgi:hypothetical protein
MVAATGAMDCIKDLDMEDTPFTTPSLPEQVTIKYLLALTIADIDIFLLLNEEQTADNDQDTFTREEIRNQLKNTMVKTARVLEDLGYDIDVPMEFKIRLA